MAGRTTQVSILGDVDIDDPAHRITDKERSAALSVLRRAAEDGRLDPGELDARMEQVRTAIIRGQVRTALDGLGALGEESTLWPTESRAVASPPQLPTPPIVQDTPALPTPAGYRADDRLTIGGGSSSENRKGVWSIPPFLRLLPRVGSVKLDCRSASVAGDVIDVEVGVGMGSITLVLPDGWAVNADRLKKGLGTVKVKVPGHPSPGAPTLFLHGQVGVGTVTARPANWFERKTARP